jgi:hypothetical protein
MGAGPHSGVRYAVAFSTDDAFKEGEAGGTPQGLCPAVAEFARDSPLEEAGFEPSVPLLLNSFSLTRARTRARAETKTRRVWRSAAAVVASRHSEQRPETAVRRRTSDLRSAN